MQRKGQPATHQMPCHSCPFQQKAKMIAKTNMHAAVMRLHGERIHESKKSCETRREKGKRSSTRRRLGYLGSARWELISRPPTARLQCLVLPPIALACKSWEFARLTRAVLHSSSPTQRVCSHAHASVLYITLLHYYITATVDCRLTWPAYQLAT